MATSLPRALPFEPHERRVKQRRPDFALSGLAAAVQTSLIFGLTLGGISIATPVLAQTERSTPNAKQTFNIPAGPLDRVLNAFASAAGVELSVDASLLKGKNSGGLNGGYTVGEGFAELLRGQGLQAVRQTNGSYTLGKVLDQTASEGMNVLPTVHVTGSADDENASSPVIGFVAKRSATGTKTDTPIIETPQSVSVVTRDEMDARGIRDVGEATAYTAGVFSGSQGETSLFGGNAVQIRGFGGSGTAGLSFNEYLDGLKMSGTGYDGANLDPYLFERVEVLKGPASVLFGQNQPGGVVNMVSKRPHAGMVNEVRLGTGNRDHINGAFDLGGALGDNLLFRVTGLVLDGDTQQDQSDRKRKVIAPSLTWSDNNTSITLLAHHQQDDVNASLLSIIPAAGVFDNPNGRISPNFRIGDPDYEYWDRKTSSLGYLFSHAFNDFLTVRQNVRYSRNALDSQWLFRRSLNPDRRTLNRSAFSVDEDAGNLTIDNQIELKVQTGEVRHTVLAGFDYRRITKDAVRHFGFAGVPTIDLFSPVYNQNIPAQPIYQSEEVKERQVGVYLQNQMKIGALSLLVGGRYDDARSTIDNRLNDSTIEQHDHAFTGRLGAIYNFANGLAPYASYAESFEPISGTAFDGSQFKPMEGRQYEAGIKYQSVGSNSFATLAVFDLTQRNMTTSDLNNFGFSTQTGEVRTRGIELEGKASFKNGLSLTAAYTYLDDEVTKSNTANLGTRRAQIPKHTASVWADYVVHNGALAGLGIGLGARYVGDTQGDRAGIMTFTVPSYTLFDAALRYDLGKSPLALRGWNLDVNVNNLFDKEYVPSCFAAHSCYIGVSRTIRATARYNW